MDEWLAGWLQHVYGHWSSDLLNSTVAKGPHKDFENMSCAVAWVAPWPRARGPVALVALVARWPRWPRARARRPVLVARGRGAALVGPCSWPVIVILPSRVNHTSRGC